MIFSCNEPTQLSSGSVSGKGAFRAYSLLASGLRRPLTRRMIRTAWAHIGRPHRAARRSARSPQYAPASDSRHRSRERGQSEANHIVHS